MADAKPVVSAKGKVGAFTKMDAAIKDCKNCKGKGPAADFQDAKYGNNKRAMNPSAQGYRCTVCQTPQSF